MSACILVAYLIFFFCTYIYVAKKNEDYRISEANIVEVSCYYYYYYYYYYYHTSNMTRSPKIEIILLISRYGYHKYFRNYHYYF